MRRHGLSGGVALALFVLWTGDAGASALEQSRLQKGIAAYNEGRYDEALLLLDEVTDSPNATKEQRVEALKYQAFALYLLDVKEEAKVMWSKLLAVDPTFRLSRVNDSPVFVQFFRDVEPPPEAIKATDVGAGELPKEETAVSTTLEEPTERGCGVALCLIPFGVGQFSNDNVVKGAIFAAAEVAFLGANLGIAYQRRSAYVADKVGFDQDADKRNANIQNVFFGLFVAAAIGGVVDAFLFP